MKKFSLIILLLLGFVISSCEKDKELILDDELIINYEIIGEWTWLRSYSGFSGTLYTPENTGVNRSLIFMENDSVYIMENADTINKADYFLSREISILLHEEFDFVTMNFKFRISNPDSIITLPMRYMIITLNDTLILDHDAYDSGTSEYVRNNNR